MSDTKLRELERRWKETGAVDDEAAYLLERVRVGDLTQERLELAAYCGHEGSRRLVYASGPTLLQDASALVASRALPSGRKTTLGQFSHQLLVTIGHAALQQALEEAANTRYSRTLSQIADWLRCPCGKHANAASNSLSSTAGELVRQERSNPTLLPLGGAVTALMHAVMSPNDAGTDVLIVFVCLARVFGQDRLTAVLRRIHTAVLEPE